MGVTGIGYNNARFHGLRSYLLPRAQIEAMAEFTDLGQVITELRDTSYREFIERAMLSGDKLHALDIAINEYISFISEKVTSAARGEILEVFKLLFHRWDVNNLKIALRGLVAEINLDLNLIPFGRLSVEEFSHIGTAKDLKEVYGLLQTYRSPLSRPIKRLVDTPIDLFLIDTSLDQYYYREVINTLSRHQDQKNAQLARKMFLEEMELRNIQNILQIITQIFNNTLSPRIDPFQVLLRGSGITASDSVAAAIKKLDSQSLLETCQETRYRTYFEDAQVGTSFVEKIPDISLQIENDFISRQIRHRHLGETDIRLGLGYFWQLMAETRNLRIIVHGIFGFLHHDDIRRHFVFG